MFDELFLRHAGIISLLEIRSDSNRIRSWGSGILQTILQYALYHTGAFPVGGEFAFTLKS